MTEELNEDLVTVADDDCHDTGFTTLPNQIHDNKNLEALAKMLYWHLERYRTFTKWKTHDSEIRKFLGCGIKVLQRLFRQLTDEGFISYIITHRNGRIVSKVRKFAPLPIHKGKKKFKTINYNVDRNCPDSNYPDSNHPVIANTNPLTNTKSNNNSEFKYEPTRPVVVDPELDKELAGIGITPSSRRAWIRAYKPDQIREAIRLFQSDGGVKNPSKWMCKALEQGWEPAPTPDIEYNRNQSAINKLDNTLSGAI